MNTISSFRLCTLSNEDLIKKVDSITDNMYKTQKVPNMHIPAMPDDDYDLLVGELLQRFSEKWISIENKLPDLEVDVLLFNDWISSNKERNTNKVVGRLVSFTTRKTIDKTVFDCEWAGNEFIFNITHWMPLPIDPKP